MGRDRDGLSRLRGSAMSPELHTLLSHGSKAAGWPTGENRCCELLEEGIRTRTENPHVSKDETRSTHAPNPSAFKPVPPAKCEISDLRD